jgi:hypothetical protein
VKGGAEVLVQLDAHRGGRSRSGRVGVAHGVMLRGTQPSDVSATARKPRLASASGSSKAATSKAGPWQQGGLDLEVSAA